MFSDQAPYRELYDQILDYDGAGLHHDVLRPWLDRNGAERRWLDEIRARRGSPVPPVTAEESCRLYALSRIIDLLQLSFAPPAPEPRWTIAAVSAKDFVEFADALGLERIDQTAFHPFYHEIVTVDAEPNENATPRLVDAYWPGLMLGPLLLSRTGCRVAAGRRHIMKEVAETSTLHWAYARNNRPATDLSAGWGSNSQWRTAFRRDYAIDGELRYNVDARENPGGAGEALDPAERLELLRHRCFIISPTPSGDLWPYDLSHVEHA
ncbi:MAG TPA: hypothetical protein VFJ16_27615 [Longimicrobium sp.]|nr:hypothetical protein [Longimicrobium sp.]